MREVRSKWLPPEARNPDAIVVVSAHWESDPIQITASAQPSMLYDYNGFPPETYEYQYPAPGSPALARKIQNLLSDHAMDSQLNKERGFDHGVFVPLMLMFPEADIPVVAVSLHSSLAPETHLALGRALRPLRDENILIVGSGYTFHNMRAFFSAEPKYFTAALEFNAWLQDTLTTTTTTKMASRLERLRNWETLAPSARTVHPREEHLLPLLVVAATALTASEDDDDDDDEEPAAQVIYDSLRASGTNSTSREHAVSSFLFP